MCFLYYGIVSDQTSVGQQCCCIKFIKSKFKRFKIISCHIRRKAAGIRVAYTGGKKKKIKLTWSAAFRQHLCLALLAATLLVFAIKPFLLLSIITLRSSWVKDTAHDHFISCAKTIKCQAVRFMCTCTEPEAESHGLTERLMGKSIFIILSYEW